MWPLKSGPTQLTRRIVAVDDKLYVTLARATHVTCWMPRRRHGGPEYPETKFVEEILVEGKQMLGAGASRPRTTSAPRFRDPGTGADQQAARTTATSGTRDRAASMLVDLASRARPSGTERSSRRAAVPVHGRHARPLPRRRQGRVALDRATRQPSQWPGT